MRQVTYDPDEFVLDKQTWLEIIEGINQYWSLNGGSNQTLLKSLTLLKWWLNRQSDEDVKTIWKLIIKFIDHLRYKNALHGSILDKEQHWGSVMSQVKTKSVFGI